MASEDDVVEALAEPALYPHHPDRVDHLQTHLSHVFVAPPFAYKLKKAVRFTFADFSTAELRRAGCHAEVDLNRRLCAPLYLGVLPVLREANGRIALGDEPARAETPFLSASLSASGPPVEHVVWMRALPAEGMGRVALAQGRISAQILGRFAAALARFHADLPPEDDTPTSAWREALEQRWSRVLEDSRGMVGRLLTPLDREVLGDFGPTFVRRHANVFDARARAGRIREGHGDLHLGNLCLIEHALPALARAPAVPAGLYAFDCVEFSRELRVNDVAAEVAFLAMDLEVEGRPELARQFVHDYAVAADDRDLVAVLPFFVSHRAAIRGMVHGLAADQPELEPDERATSVEQARAHFALAARRAWQSAGPALIACTGLSGSGKTTLAAALARATGFRLLSSDEMRKRRAGLDPRARSHGEDSARLYTEEARHAVYVALAGEAEAHLAQGECVIVDATFHRAVDRSTLAVVAGRIGCPLLFAECRVDDDTARLRLAARAAAQPDDGAPAASDADWSVREGQQRANEPVHAPTPHFVLDMAGDRDAAIERALRSLWAWRREHAMRTPATAGPRV